MMTTTMAVVMTTPTIAEMMIMMIKDEKNYS